MLVSQRLTHCRRIIRRWKFCLSLYKKCVAAVPHWIRQTLLRKGSLLLRRHYHTTSIVWCICSTSWRKWCFWVYVIWKLTTSLLVWVYGVGKTWFPHKALTFSSYCVIGILMEGVSIERRHLIFSLYGRIVLVTYNWLNFVLKLRFSWWHVWRVFDHCIEILIFLLVKMQIILGLWNLSWYGFVDVYGTVCWFCWTQVASPRFSLHSAVDTTVEVAEKAVETIFPVVPFQNFLMIGWTFVAIKRMPFLGPKS